MPISLFPETYIDVAVGIPGGNDSFQYSVPENLKNQIQIGKRVFLNMRSRRMVGYIVGQSDTPVVDTVKPIESIIDAAPIIDAPLLELCRWMSSYYFCSLGQAIEAAMPAAFKKGKINMKSRGKKTEAFGDFHGGAAPVMTPDQERAFETIWKTCAEKKPGAFVLRGITGSGKTEIYMRLIERLLKEDGGSIVLVPEISLTPQTVGRFQSRFGEELAVIHSRLTQARRVEEWQRIRSGKARVVVGARSGIFSPVKNLRLIVIDEEHDTSYKQEETPRYHTRETAQKRAELENAVLLMGSATPSLEAYHRAQNKIYSRVELLKRIEDRPLPAVEIVDMRVEKGPKGAERIFSEKLEKAVKESLAKKEQVMLLLNRRGFFTYLHCSSCGYVAACQNCRIPMTYHFDKGALLCHICSYRQPPEKLCPGCKKSQLHYFGTGTQKVEAEAQKLFFGARIGRMDADSTSRKDAHEKILSAFKKNEIDLLIGTQMIAKGHDFPNVSLIGVINADTALHIPDFRSAERTFDLLTQVAGRAGRGDIPGKVIVQTFVPQHYSIQSAKDHDYLEFYHAEITFRQELFMPPFSSLARVVVTGSDEKEVVRQILELKNLAETRIPASFKLLGPAPCLISKENGQFRWNLYFKAPDASQLNGVLRGILEGFKKKGVSLTVDMDPQ